MSDTIKKVYHITFPVSDLKKAVAFYENVLGLKKTGEWPTYAIFDVGGVQLVLSPVASWKSFCSSTTLTKPTGP